MDIDAVVFDLGNVLIEVDFERAVSHWCRYEQIDRRALHGFLSTSAHHDFETGRIDARRFFQLLRDHTGMSLDDARLTAGWNAVLLDEITGIRSWIERCKARMPVYCFSNTNAVHHEHWSQQHADLLKTFDDVFVSHRLGLRKPEPAAFEKVVKSIGLEPSRVLFFDDSEINITGARAVGINAIQVQSTDDVATALAGLPV